MSQFQVLSEAIDSSVVCILAGGKGERLMPLTKHRAKPAVPFAGKYRIIDFALSNAVNSKFNKIYVFPQHLNQSLNNHLEGGWNIFSAEMDHFLRVVSPQGRVTDSWYSGTAASIFENFHSIGADSPKYIIVLSSDQVYKMDYRELLQDHIESGAELTIAALPVKRSEASRFGILEVDSNRRLCGFEEKPKAAKSIPERPEESLASMGIYIFTAKALVDNLTQDMSNPVSRHDFGKNVIPMMLGNGSHISVFLFQNRLGKACHWVDVGTIDSYYESNMDLASANPCFDLYDNSWPWRTFQRPTPPTKTFLHAETWGSIISDGCLLHECRIIQSVISPRVRIGTNSNVKNSIIMSGVSIGNDVLIENAIIDKENVIKDGSRISAGHMNYHGSTYTVTKSGIVIIPRNYPVWTGD